MKVSKLEKVDLDLYSETLSNGLRVYIIPKDNVNGIEVTLTTNYGSACCEFIPNGSRKMLKVPLGVAHFLEHKMFEQADGVDPFSFYSERGCDANASTSQYKTTYFFSGTNAFYDNLNFLLDYVQSPYFTDENVKKEKGIIEQELKMYQDDPYNRVYEGVIFNLMHKHPIKYPIGGTIESVRSITKEDLYACYNTFYHPSNMILVIVGNVEPIETISTIKANQDKKKFDKPKAIKVKEYDEPNEVFKKQEKVKMDVEIPKLGIGYKIDCSCFKENMHDIRNYIDTIFKEKLGSTSLLYEKLKKENLITSGISISTLKTNKHVLVVIMTETKEQNKVLSLIEEELKDLSMDENALSRRRKVLKSACIYRSDNIYALNSKIVGNILNYDAVVLDDYKKTDEFNLKNFKKLTSKINLDNNTVYYINKS